jgi:hypothetical protein
MQLHGVGTAFSQRTRHVRAQQQQQQKLDSSLLQKLHGPHKHSTATWAVHRSLGAHSSCEACMVTANPDLVPSVPVQHWEAGSSVVPAAAPANLHSNGRERAANRIAGPVAPLYNSIEPSTNRLSSNNIIPVTAAAAAAAVKTSASLEQHRDQQQQQHVAAQSDCEPCSRVWLPYKQLWVPDGNGASPAPSNGSGNAVTSTPTQLQRVFMAAAAVSFIGRRCSASHGQQTAHASMTVCRSTQPALH